MKNVFTLLCLLFLSLTAQATVLTLNNNNPTPGQYTTFAAAHTAAAAGDTILVHGSPLTYGVAVISKKLAIIGPGHKPNTPSGLPATFDQIAISNNLVGVRLSGLRIAYITGVSSQSLTNVDSLIIDNSFFFGVGGFGLYAGTDCNHLVIRNSIFQFAIIQFGGTNIDDVVLENNFLVAPGILAGWGGVGNKVVSNNVFAYAGSGYLLFPGSPEARNTLFQNNIFYGVTANFGTQTDCIYANNISFGSFDNQLPPNGQGGSGNLVNVDPLFVNPTPIGSLISFQYTRDYRLQPGSPAIGAGTFGTDIGMYEPDFTFSKTGEPARPQATALLPNPVSVPVNGTTNVNFTIRKSTTETN